MKFTKDIYFDRKVTENSVVNILYTGKLYKNTSSKVYIVYKYGVNCDFEFEQEMSLSNIGYVVDVFIDGNYTFDFYFKNEEGLVDKNKNKYYIATINPKIHNIDDIGKDTDFLMKEIDGLEDISSNKSTNKIVKRRIIKEEIDSDENDIKKKVEKKKVSTKNNTNNVKNKIEKSSSTKAKGTKNTVEVKKSVTNKISDKKNIEKKAINIIENKDDNKVVVEKNNLNKSIKNKNETSLYNIANKDKNNELGKRIIKQFEDEHKQKVKIKRWIFFQKDKKRRAGIRSLCAIALFFCVGYGISYFMESKNVQSDAQDLLNSVAVDNTIVENIVEDTTIENTIPCDTERMLQVKELNKQYPELKAWIEIEGTNINYPVMQGQDNDFYMNHDYKKNYSRWGTLFVDASYVWDPASSNKLIYGHNFSDGVMLSDLLKYKDEEFYYAHPSIRFTTPEEDAEYDIIAVFYSRVYYQTEEDVFRYYYFVNAENRDEYNDFVNQAKAASIYDIRKAAVYGEELLTLSTCEYSQKDGRFVVVARKKY